MKNFSISVGVTKLIATIVSLFIFNWKIALVMLLFSIEIRLRKGG
jgi:hypothetical protein